MATDSVGAHLEAILGINKDLREAMLQAAEQLEESFDQSELPERIHAAFKKTLLESQSVQSFMNQYNAVVREEERISVLKTELESVAQTKAIIRWSRDPEYSLFRERVWEINHPEQVLPLLSQNDNASEEEDEEEDDNDLVVANTKQTFTCPLSQTTFVDPVTNVPCGHTYSRQAITALAQLAPRIPCPIHGCRSTVVIAQLVKNDSLERRVARINRPRIFDNDCIKNKMIEL